MAEQENTELTSSYEQVKTMSTQGAILSENRMKTSRKTLLKPGL